MAVGELMNFVLMSIFFSLNHGCVVSLVGLATADLGDELGFIQNGVLYGMYTLSALVAAAPITKRLGAKDALSTSLSLYVVYVGSFLLASEVPSVDWYAALAGAAIGGFAAGWLWVGQGAYFARAAQQYALANGVPITQANGLLAGIFSCLYLGLEVTMNGTYSILHLWGGNTLVYIVFTSTAALCVLGMVLLVRPNPPQHEGADAPLLGADESDSRHESSADPLTPESEKPINSLAGTSGTAQEARGSPPWYEKVVVALKFLAHSRKMQLLAPLSCSFGFTAAYVVGFINGTPAKAAVGQSNLGYLNALIPGTAALLTLPVSWLTKRASKLPVMIFGALCYTSVAVIGLALGEDGLEDLGWKIAIIYVIFGAGRSVFENTNKAVFADFFPNQLEAVFANVVVFNGSASTLGFFLFPHLHARTIAIIVVSSGVLASVAMVFAFRLHRLEQRVH